MSQGAVFVRAKYKQKHIAPCLPGTGRSACARHSAARNTHCDNQSLCYTQGCDLWAPHIYNLRDTGLRDVLLLIL